MEIRHDLKSQRFTLKLNGKEATLSYNLEDGIMDILLVSVPIELSGKGIAEKITLHVFSYAKEKGYKITPTCSYVKNKFLKDRTEFNNITFL